jgi:hypothetical protein
VAAHTENEKKSAQNSSEAITEINGSTTNTLTNVTRNDTEVKKIHQHTNVG